MATHPFDILSLDSGAKFIFTPCPGTKDTTAEASVAQLKQAGTQAIITLMYSTEMDDNNASDLPNICKQQQIKWFQLPISDDAAPNQDFSTNWSVYLADIIKILEQQGTVAVHCKGGSGRTGLVIGLLLNKLGIDKKKAKELVQSIRPKALTNPVQLGYFEHFVE